MILLYYRQKLQWRSLFIVPQISLIRPLYVLTIRHSGLASVDVRNFNLN